MSEFGGFAGADDQLADNADFNADFGAAAGNASFLDDTSADPAADFLAREQAVLGADAAFFGNDLVSSVPVDETASQPAHPISAHHTGTSSNASVPGVHQPPFTSEPSFTGSIPEPEQEPEVLKQWRADFQSRIAERDDRAAQKHQEIITSAKESIERFYADYNSKKTKSIQRNKDQEKRIIEERDDLTSGTVWDRALRLIEQAAKETSSVTKTTKAVVDLKPTERSKDKDTKNVKPIKVRDTSRMKQVLISLRKDARAPGVEANA
ncbi:hypothetical protein HDU85_005333 [Gaertneriomyces sp. JEL0708]|nr:hypothetical protein HDU85_005333 [Gaertneriomyces sp. JEL0708]